MITKNKQETFKEALINLTKEYRSKNQYYNDVYDDYVISSKDFGNLSAFEKRTIRTIGKMYNLFNSKIKHISYNELVETLDQLAIDRTNDEKQYLLALFFPERIKHINIVYPFPIPTYPFIQKINGRINPNSTGNFVVQAVCPLLLDTTKTGSSVLYINTDDDLDGITKDSTKAHYVPVSTFGCIPGAFNAYVLQCFKLTIEYVGRPDIQSGFFGGAYFISTSNSLDPDYNASIFNYIDDSINAVKVNSKDGLNTIYYPLDDSYTHFMTVNTDNVATHAMNTSIRLAIYGSALPPGVDSVNGSLNSVNYNVCAIYNTIPSQQFNELLPVDFMVQGNEKFSLVGSAQFVNSSKLAAWPTSRTGEIERMLELPSNIKKNAIQSLVNESKIFGSNTKYKNILDILEPLVGTEIPADIKLDVDLFKNTKGKLPEPQRAEIEKSDKMEDEEVE